MTQEIRHLIAEILKAVALVIVLIWLYLFYHIPAPPPVRVIAPTEASIIREVKNEELARRYKNAGFAAAQVYRRNGCRTNFADLTGRVSVDSGLSPRVLAALVFVESSCNAAAVSNRDGVGLMQVNTHVWHYTRAELKNPDRNMRVGAKILSTYLHKFGLVEGLHHYNGMGDVDGEYSNKVLSAAGIQIS